MGYSSHRRSGANQRFAAHHPRIARVLGDAEARSLADMELGRRHWIGTLFGGVIGVAVCVGGGLLAASWTARHAWASRPDGWPLWTVASCAGAFLVALLAAAWWRDPLRGSALHGSRAGTVLAVLLAGGAIALIIKIGPSDLPWPAWAAIGIGALVVVYRHGSRRFWW